jgi:hypothetical protein
VGFERRAVCQVEAPAAEPTGLQQGAELGAIGAFDSRGALTTACTDRTVSVLVDHVKEGRLQGRSGGRSYRRRRDLPDVVDRVLEPRQALEPEAGGEMPSESSTHVGRTRRRWFKESETTIRRSQPANASGSARFARRSNAFLPGRSPTFMIVDRSAANEAAAGATRAHVERERERAARCS